jgi:hypothetical protein
MREQKQPRAVQLYTAFGSGPHKPTASLPSTSPDKPTLVKPRGSRLAEHPRTPCHQAARQPLVPIVLSLPDRPSAKLGGGIVKTIRHAEATHQGMNRFVNEASVLEDMRDEVVANLAAAQQLGSFSLGILGVCVHSSRCKDTRFGMRLSFRSLFSQARR